MCISFLYLQGRRVLIASNRDEVFSRVTIPLCKWSHEGKIQILSGKDGVAGGLWLGVSDRGRWAVLTNFRDLAMSKGELSRGAIVKAWLTEENRSAAEFLQRLEGEVEAGKHSPFSVAFGQVRGSVPSAHYFTNGAAAFAKRRRGTGSGGEGRDQGSRAQAAEAAANAGTSTTGKAPPTLSAAQAAATVAGASGSQAFSCALTDGFHSISNAVLDSGWRKERRGLRSFRNALVGSGEGKEKGNGDGEGNGKEKASSLASILFSALLDDAEILIAPEGEEDASAVPRTGFPRLVESKLSSIFISAFEAGDEGACESVTVVEVNR